MAVSSGEVPGKYDIVLTFGAASYGFVFSNTVDQSLPFRVQRADYSYSPTFIQRTNVQGDYGDNQQDFYLTFTQRDWSLGERQNFFRQADSASQRRYYQGTAADIRIPGQVTQRQAVKTLTAAAAVQVCTPYDQTRVAFTTATNLYLAGVTGSITDIGAHGVGVTPTGLVSSAGNVYATGEGGTVRQYNGVVFSTFSASPATELEYLNNTLFGFIKSTAKLVQWTTGGTRSDVYSWLEPAGNIRSVGAAKLRAYGGSLLAMISFAEASGTELWQYNGTATSLVAKLPPNFWGARICIVQGIVFVSGILVAKDDGTTRSCIPAIYFYANGSLGILWQSDIVVTTTTATALEGRSPAMCAFDNGLVFANEATGQLMMYDIGAGGVSSIGAYTVDGSGNPTNMASCASFFLQTHTSTGVHLYPDPSNVAASTTISTSLADFDSSLTKYIKSIKVEADIPAGATVDVAYQLDSVAGAYTTLQTGLTSGTEYTVGTTGHSISVKVTLNKGSSAAGPTLKRISVKAAPILPAFRLDQFILDCSGRDGKNMVPLRDGTRHPKDGMELVADIRSAITQTAPIQATDRFGTFTCIALPDQSEIIEIRPEEFVVKLALREV